MDVNFALSVFKVVVLYSGCALVVVYAGAFIVMFYKLAKLK